MKVRDLQFFRSLLKQELDVCPCSVEKLLDYEILIQYTGDPDNIVDRGTSILYTNPTSITRFLFQVSYTLLSKFVQDEVQKDKLSLVLLCLCREYVYHDENCDSPDMPLITDFRKATVSSFVARELIEPLAGRIEQPKIIYIPCQFTDVCRIVDSQTDFGKEYGLSNYKLKNEFFPALVCNLNIKNPVARDADLLIKILELSYGEEKTQKAIKNILLDENNGVMAYLVDILYTLTGKAEYVFEFLRYLDAYTSLSETEETIVVSIQFKVLSDNKHIKEHVKLASDNYTPAVQNQWSQWSMLVGLIEKQLGSMRGSLWPTTEALKPLDDQRKKIYLDVAKKKKKTQLNMEELLEVTRDIWKKNAVEPGKLIEEFLGNTRVWA